MADAKTMASMQRTRSIKQHKTTAFTYRHWLICIGALLFTLRLDHVDSWTVDDIFSRQTGSTRRVLPQTHSAISVMHETHVNDQGVASRCMVRCRLARGVERVLRFDGVGDLDCWTDLEGFLEAARIGLVSMERQT
jgi:hypothetical protein